MKTKISLKETRQLVYSKYDGKCAYCGQELKAKWHMNHLAPVVRNWWDGTCNHPENNNIDNLMPSCPQCNILKNSHTLEHFREIIGKYIKSLNAYSTQYRMAKKYGLVEETNTEVKFYFENYGN